MLGYKEVRGEEGEGLKWHKELILKTKNSLFLLYLLSYQVEVG